MSASSSFLISFSSCLFLMILLGACSQKLPAQLEIRHNAADWKHMKQGPDSMQLVDLEKFIPGLKKDIHYATTGNFTGRILYNQPAIFLRKTAAEKLGMVQDSLHKLGLQLIVFDGYRPYQVTRKMWEVIPDERYAANPAKGSGHNRGIAVDLSLADLKTGEPLKMPTGYDSFTDTAHAGFPHLPDENIRNREMLKSVMMHFGFLPLETEWWHFYLPAANRYPLMNFSFKALRKWGL